jgi:hypothetical protein
MSRRSQPLPAPLATLALVLPLLLAPLPAAADSSLVVGGGNASATLNFRIVIPPVMRVLENHHPSELQPDAAGELGGQQRLVVVSNMRRGFCVGLRAAEPQRAGWQLSTANTGGVTLTPVADGYRLCTAGPGRYTLLLEHRFTTSGEQWARRWPVQTDLMAM